MFPIRQLAKNFFCNAFRRSNAPIFNISRYKTSDSNIEEIQVLGVEDINGAKVRVDKLIYDISYKSEIIRPRETDLILPPTVNCSQFRSETKTNNPFTLVNEAGAVIYVSKYSAASGFKNQNLEKGCDQLSQKGCDLNKVTSLFNKVDGAKIRIGTVHSIFKLDED